MTNWTIISIHALLAESDWKKYLVILGRVISIHALLAESDKEKPRQTRTDTNFYPRSPCGERRKCRCWVLSDRDFYPRSPCGERLWPGLLARPFFIISIHALLAESDLSMGLDGRFKLYFYPRSPCGERLSVVFLLLAVGVFLSTLSLRRAT